MQLSFAKFDGRLICALRICDDGNSGGILWSVVERDEELNGIRGLARGEPLVAFLFNELAVNVAWNEFEISDGLSGLSTWVDNVELGQVDHTAIKGKLAHLFERLDCGVEIKDWIVLEIGGRSDWKSVNNHFITAAASSSLVNIFDADEGNQQEQLGVWLTDNLQLSGVYHSPQTPKGSGTRELTDILMSYEFGAVLIESKTLSILKHEKLPSRERLQRNVSGHIAKAFSQLRGAIRSLKTGVVVTNSKGDELSIEREKPAHAIVLIPDLELIKDHASYGVDFIRDFFEATGSFPHILDISELLRIVQAAELISAQGETTTPMMAFDYYLMNRFEKAVQAGTLCIEVILRFSDDEVVEN